jgi:hypothetical protein
LLAGTASLWASEELANPVDVLFIDAAAWMSLANALAASQAIAGLVLLGDVRRIVQIGVRHSGELREMSAADAAKESARPGRRLSAKNHRRLF